jgi:hypothetical protein
MPRLLSLPMTAAPPRPSPRERASSTCNTFGSQRYAFFFLARASHTFSKMTHSAYLYQSTMPLGQLVKMIQLLARQHSVSPPSSDVVHPLHPALDDILLTGNWCTYKYQERLLPSVITAATTGAALHAQGSDLEMSIMLFVLEHHALCEEDQQQQQQQQRACCSLDDQKRWLSVIEKRE